MVDPDVPSHWNRSLAEVIYWTVVNIVGNNIVDADVLFDYIGSLPFDGSKLHRYIFLVYRQLSTIVFDETRVAANCGRNRVRASSKEFVRKYKLGQPIAGNFYQAQYDDYVPILYGQLIDKC